MHWIENSEKPGAIIVDKNRKPKNYLEKTRKSGKTPKPKNLSFELSEKTEKPNQKLSRSATPKIPTPPGYASILHAVQCIHRFAETFMPDRRYKDEIAVQGRRDICKAGVLAMTTQWTTPRKKIIVQCNPLSSINFSFTIHKYIKYIVQNATSKENSCLQILIRKH